MILRACDYKHLSSNCPVITLSTLESKFEVLIPYIVMGYRLYDILEVSCSPNRTVSFTGVEFDQIHPWVDVPTVNLNREAGKHIYKLSFMNNKMCKYINTYISYTIQDDSPYKPYLYMSDRYNDDTDKEGIYLSS